MTKQKQSGIKMEETGNGEESGSSQELDVRFERSWSDLVLQLLC